MAILGSFGKAVPGGISINYGTSAGIYCWSGCRWLDAGCYAERLERRGDRQHLAQKLRRLERLTPAQVTYAALGELSARIYEGEIVPWIRFASAGAMPSRSQWDGESRAFRQLVEAIIGWRIEPHRVHLPVESPAKRDFYRGLVGDLGIVPRLSVQTDAVTQRGPCSYVAGEAGTTRRERMQAARELKARREKATGRQVAICPHTAWWYSRGVANQPGKVKCGGCTLCGREDVDIVYPLT